MTLLTLQQPSTAHITHVYNTGDVNFPVLSYCMIFDFFLCSLFPKAFALA